MLNIHATKKLYAKLPVDDDGLLASSMESTSHLGSSPSSPLENPLDNWHGNLITLQRRNCVMLVHDSTRFPLFIPRLVKMDFANFNWHFADILINTLLRLDASQRQMDAAIALLAPCRFDTICNRSVQGTLNQMKFDIENLLWFRSLHIEELSAYRTGAEMSDRPCTVKGRRDCVWPKQAMFELLSEVANNEITSVDSAKVVQFADYRRQIH